MHLEENMLTFRNQGSAISADREAKKCETYFLPFTYLDNNIHFHVMDMVLEFKKLKLGHLIGWLS